MSRGGLPREGGIRQRTCLGCRQTREKHGLVRLVVGPGGLVRDEGQALPGRGAYVCPSEACAAKASRQLAKALRSPGLSVSQEAAWLVVSGRDLPVPQFEARPPDEDEPVG